MDVTKRIAAKIHTSKEPVDLIILNELDLRRLKDEVNKNFINKTGLTPSIAHWKSLIGRRIMGCLVCYDSNCRDIKIGRIIK